MPKSNFKILNILLLFALAAVIFFAAQLQPRNSFLSSYEEIHIVSPLESIDEMHQSFMTPEKLTQSSSSNSSIEWLTPQAWVEEAGQGMRVITFKNKSNLNEIDCSIVSLGQEASGIEENLIRWAKQINVELSDERLKKLLHDKTIWKTKDGQEIQVFDFSEHQLESDAPSIMATIIQTSNSTVFVKMTGTKEAIRRNKKPFQELNESLTRIQ